MAKKKGICGVLCDTYGCVHNDCHGRCEESWEDISLDAQGRCIYRKLSDPLG